MDFHIIDNFLTQEQFNNIKQACFSKDCEDNVNWFRNRVVNKEDDNYYFSHQIFYEYQPSVLFPFMEPLLSKLNPKCVKRIKLNYYPATEKVFKHDSHKDYPFPHKGAIFSLNTCDGGTYFGDQHVQSIENRIILFDPGKDHGSTTTTKKEGRCNININYF